MRVKVKLKPAHGDNVNSHFVCFDAGVVISIDNDSIRLWDPVNGTEFYQAEMNGPDDSVIPGLGSIYKMESVGVLD